MAKQAQKFDPLHCAKPSEQKKTLPVIPTKQPSVIPA
jgi:hypothetical protein